jgi:hypothetical protein
MIVLQPERWQNIIKPRLVQDHGAKIMISYVCRRELGFTVREHKGWVDNPNYQAEMFAHGARMEEVENRRSGPHSTEDALEWLMMTAPRKGERVNQICLDFYNDAAETYFRLRYL